MCVTGITVTCITGNATSLGFSTSRESLEFIKIAAWYKRRYVVGEYERVIEQATKDEMSCARWQPFAGHQPLRIAAISCYLPVWTSTLSSLRALRRRSLLMHHLFGGVLLAFHSFGGVLASVGHFLTSMDWAFIR